MRLQEESVQQLWASVGAALAPETATAEHLELVRAVTQDQPEKAQKQALEHRAEHFHLNDTKLTLGYSQSIQEPDETRH